MVAAQYAIDFLAEPRKRSSTAPRSPRRRNQPRPGRQVALCQATTAEARDAIHDARTARHAAIKGIHDARAAARREEKRGE